MNSKLCFEFSQTYFETVFEQGKAAVLLFLDQDNQTQSRSLIPLCKAALNKSFNMAYSYSGFKEGVQQRLAEFIGVSEEKLPMLFIIDFNTTIWIIHNPTIQNFESIYPILFK